MTAVQLKEIRERHQLTQRGMGQLLGYTPNYISRLERGDEPISQRLERLVKALLQGRKIVKSPEIP